MNPAGLRAATALLDAVVAGSRRSLVGAALPADRPWRRRQRLHRHLRRDRPAEGRLGYVGEGTNRWPAVHRSDAARLVRLAVEAAPAGSVLHAVGDEGVPFREIAEAIGRHLDVSTTSITPADALEHFSVLGHFASLDSPATAEVTRELLGWQPTGPGLIEDLDQGHYFTPSS